MTNANPDMINWDLYEIHPNGTIWSHAKGRPLKGCLDKGGHQVVKLQMQVFGEEQFRVSRLVARKYVDNPENLPEVRHIDGCKSNNSWRNLEWSKPHGVGADGPTITSKLSEDDVLDMRWLRSMGVATRALAREYKIDPKTARDAISGRTWSHL